ncbi:NADPH-dependent 7-cyano-7-deazaguanine reductase QueF [Pseudoteredinibacter isoporae]
MDHLQLGKHTEYVSVYTPSLLDPIPRAAARAELALNNDRLPFAGVDVWTGYEISWLNSKGLPQQAIAVFSIPADSPNIIESKSFKLYLNSFNQTRFGHRSEVIAALETDLSAAAGARVLVDLEGLDQFAAVGVQRPRGICIDHLDVAIDCYSPDDSLLQADGELVSETLYSDLLKSNCPVTAQPDWATLIIRYRGAAISQEGLLRYIVSYREHQDFHENCVERIYCDIMARCKPESLMVYARYTRRGGLDINPLRHSLDDNVDALDIAARLVRQ